MPTSMSERERRTSRKTVDYVTLAGGRTKKMDNSNEPIDDTEGGDNKSVVSKKSGKSGKSGKSKKSGQTEVSKGKPAKSHTSKKTCEDALSMNSDKVSRKSARGELPVDLTDDEVYKAAKNTLSKDEEAVTKSHPGPGTKARANGSKG